MEKRRKSPITAAFERMYRRMPMGERYAFDRWVTEYCRRSFVAGWNASRKEARRRTKETS